jgi:hypothetical protein
MSALSSRPIVVHPRPLELEVPVSRWIAALSVSLCAACFTGCAPPAVDEPEDGGPARLPPFEEDCGNPRNDTLQTASGLDVDDDRTWEGIALCTDDVDYYRLDVPPGRWVSLRVTIDGSGSGQTDLDLYEVDADDAVVQGSASGQPFERIAFYNPGAEPAPHYVRVEGFQGGRADYDILTHVSRYHEDVDCDEMFPDEDPADERGPCNTIMQFPQGNDDVEGYLVTHAAHYSNLRREVQYLVRYAAREVAAAFPDTEPLGLLDMSQWDGDTPGRMEGQLRHPEGTHVDGNDIDIAYYSLSPGNEGKVVCPQNDGYWCTGPASDLDVDRTTFFLAKLMDNMNVRVTGVDTAVAERVAPRAAELEEEGLITREQRQRVQGLMAYGDGWPFHHHHIHLSWQWEDGHEERDGGAEGCLLGPEL